MLSIDFSNIRKIRKERGISIYALAEMSGVSKTQINTIERNLVQPTLYTIAMIAKALSVQVEQLYVISWD